MDLLKRLERIVPAHLSRFFFCNSGSEAVDNAIKARLLIFYIWGLLMRPEFVLFQNGVLKQKNCTRLLPARACGPPHIVAVHLSLLLVHPSVSS